jgi:predicted dehydrogenase
LPRVPNLRVAIVGAGLMGRAHARAALRAGAKVVAVSDADLVVAKKVALALGTGALYGSLDEVIRPDRIDAVHVCTPAGRHLESAHLALDRGLHVLCEKPVAETVDETQELFERAARNGVILCPSQQFPFQQGAIDAAAHLPAIGKIRWITAEMCTAGAATLVDSLHDEVVLNILPHPLSLIYGFLGGAISEGTWSPVRAERGEMLVTGVVRDTGISIVLSSHGRPTSNSMRLIGERGAITLDLFHGFSIAEDGRVSRTRKFMRPFASSAKFFAAATRNSASRALARETEFPGLTELCRRFYLAADKRGPTPITPAEALDLALVRDQVIAQLMNPA